MVEPSVAGTIKSAKIPPVKRGILALHEEGILGFTKHPKKRIWEIDFLRGFCVLLMILDHTAILLADFFGPIWYGRSLVGDGIGPALCRLCATYLNSNLREIGHPIVLFFFFSICGISCSLSRNNLKRALQLSFLALTLSVLTYVTDFVLGIKGTFIHFGVLHFLSFCLLSYAFLELISKKNKIVISLFAIAAVVATSLVYHLYRPTEAIPGIWQFFLGNAYIDYGMPITYTHIDSYSLYHFSPLDFFPIVPWIAFFYFGVLVQPLIYGKKRSLLAVLDRGWQRPVSFLGRHALIIYALHTVVIGLILMVISQIVFGTWGLI